MADDITGQMARLDLSTPLRTDAEILDRVDCLIDPSDRRRRTLWLMFLAADATQLPVLVPIDDLPKFPDALLVANLCGVIAQTLAETEPDGAAVLALARPGTAVINQSDRMWFQALHDAAALSCAAIRMVCLATSDGVRDIGPQVSG